jgi:uncharacterized membrane protein
MPVRSTKVKQVDREIGLVVAGALAILFGGLLLTNTQAVAQKTFQCVPVTSLDGVKIKVTCETSPSSILAVEIAGAALGICGTITAVISAVNWSR